MSDPDILSAPVVNLPPEPDSKWRREYLAFMRLHPWLLQTHRDKYVAVHEGKLVDVDDDEVRLALRVYQRIGYVPIYIGLVSDQPIRPVRIPTPRLVSPG